MDLTKENPAILIVEDDWLVREDIAGEFRRSGWTVLESSTGEGAIGVIESGERVVALVTDIQLAGMASGWDVAQAFREAYPDFPVVYTSANAPDPHRLVTGSVFIAKPCLPSAVVEACANVGAHPPRRASMSRF
jgi:CheY-like chemotaxis protein